jgi:hypothetical protein
MGDGSNKLYAGIPRRSDSLSRSKLKLKVKRLKAISAETKTDLFNLNPAKEGICCCSRLRIESNSAKGVAAWGLNGARAREGVKLIERDLHLIIEIDKSLAYLQLSALCWHII